MYEQVYTSTKIAKPPGSSESISGLAYCKTWDAAFVLTTQKYARVFKDGTYIQFGTKSGQYTLMQRVGGQIAWGNYWGPSITAATEINGMVIDSEWLHPVAVNPSSICLYPGMIDDIRGILVSAQGWHLKFYDTSNWSLLKTVSSPLGASIGWVGWVSEGYVCAIAPSNGRLCYVEYFDSMAVTDYARIDACRFAVYDCRCNVVWSIGTDYKTRVYVKNAWPTTLSAPVFTPTSVYGMKANTVKVRLTGQEGEPCPGWWITWALDSVGGVGPYGTLAYAISKTDDDGYAWNTYFGPMAGITGQTKVVCSVVIN